MNNNKHIHDFHYWMFEVIGLFISYILQQKFLFRFLVQMSFDKMDLQYTLSA